MDYEKKVLSLFLPNSSLSYFQLQRKLKGREMHEVVPELPHLLLQMEKENLIERDFSILSNVPFYKLTNLGKKYLD